MKRTMTKRRRALPEVVSGSERATGVRIKVGAQISMIFPESSPVADRARVSTRAALKAAIEALEAEAEASSGFGDWAAQCLEQDASGKVDQDAAFVSFWRFCTMVGLTGADRLAHREFVLEMLAAGYPLGVSRDGRRFHLGCRLADRFGGVRADEGDGDVGRFIAERCRIGGQGMADRGRSSLIYAAYCDWSHQRHARPVGLAHFAKALISRGFRRVRSNGHWWQGLRLAEVAPSAGNPE